MNQDFSGKRVLIFGLGLNEGGLGSAKFFATQKALVRVTDLKDEKVLEPSMHTLKDLKNIEYILGKHRFEDIDWADLIIKNPSVKPGNEFIEYAKKQEKLVETDMGIFLNYANPKNIIGITGTKGKSTTATLIYEVVKSANKKVLFAGNIGKSVLDTIPHISKDVLIVLEISSFQLEAFDQHKVSPHIAVITNIYPDHLNYYSSMDEYIASKKLITKYQTPYDLLFLRKDDPITSKSDFQSEVASQIRYFSERDLPKGLNPKIPGFHNRENIAAVISVAKHLEINQKKILEVIQDFKGVEFRLQLLKKWRGVKIYNDTTATAPEPAIEALRTLPGSIVVAGGMNKNMEYEKYVVELEKNAREVFFLEGDATNLMLSSLRDRRSNLLIHGPYDNLDNLLWEVKKVAKKGDTILFSPAATSFNLFQNEFDRGKKFNESVKKIFG